MARRGHLRGLSAELRRRERRRHRRPRRGAVAAAATSRDLGIDAIWFTPGTSRPSPTAATTWPTTGPSTRRFGTLDRGGGAHRRGARRWASGRSSTSSPTTCPTSTRGSRRRSPPARAPRSAPGSGSARARGADGVEHAHRLAHQLLGHHVDAHDGRGRHARRVVPAPVLRRQPDLNWDHPDVRASTRTSSGSGSTAASAGVRIDSAALLVKDAALPEVPDAAGARRASQHRPRRAPRHLSQLARDRRRLRRARASSSARSGCPTPSGSRATCARTSSTPPSTSTSWPGPGTPPRCARRSTHARGARAGRRAGDMGPVQPRRDPAGDPLRPGGQLLRVPRKRQGVPTDLDLGRRRARAAALLVAALPGSLYIYQGDELGLDEVADLPVERSRGPDVPPLRWRRPRPRRLPGAAALVGRARRRSGSARRRRRQSPGCRQPARWAALTVEAQAADPGSMLSLYRSALAHPPRRAGPARRADRAGCRRPTVCSRSSAATVRLHHQPLAATRVPARRQRACCSPARPSRTAGCRRRDGVAAARLAREPGGGARMR